MVDDEWNNIGNTEEPQYKNTSCMSQFPVRQACHQSEAANHSFISRRQQPLHTEAQLTSNSHSYQVDSNQSEIYDDDSILLTPSGTYPCLNCGKEFPAPSFLRRHILTHTGQKPFKCSYCEYSSTQKGNLNRHVYKKHGPELQIS